MDNILVWKVRTLHDDIWDGDDRMGDCHRLVERTFLASILRVECIECAFLMIKSVEKRNGDGSHIGGE